MMLARCQVCLPPLCLLRRLQYALPLLVSSLCKFADVDPVLDSFKMGGEGTRSQTWYTTRAVGGRPWDYSDLNSRIELLGLMAQGDASLARMKRRLDKAGLRIEQMFRTD